MTPSPTSDPYAPPESDLGEEPSGPVDYRLYSTTQMMGGTLLGSVLAAVWMLAANYRRVGMLAAANRTLAVGLVATVVFVGVALSIPEDVPAIVVVLPIAMGAYFVGGILQTRILHHHLQAGGRLQSNWRVVGVSLLAGAVLVVIAVIVILPVFFFFPEFLDGIE